MISNLSKSEEINVLASDENWAWPAAVETIFRPRNVNLLIARSTSEFVNIIEHKRIHTTILDVDTEVSGALTTIRMLRMKAPLLPCILLTPGEHEDILSKALELNVFSVIYKPVKMELLREQLNRLFRKKYNSDIFEV